MAQEPKEAIVKEGVASSSKPIYQEHVVCSVAPKTEPIQESKIGENNSVMVQETKKAIVKQDVASPSELIYQENVVCSVAPKTEPIQESKIVKNNSVVEQVKTKKEVALTSLDIWHRRLGHLSEELLKRTLELSQIRTTTSQLTKPCDACAIGKMKKNPRPGPSSNIASQPLERLCTDLSGRLRHPSIGGAEYFGVVVDQFTGFIAALFVKKKSEFSPKIIGWSEFAQRQTGVPVKIFRSDNAGEFDVLNQYCVEHSIKREFTVARNSFQNALAERMIGELEMRDAQ